MKTCKLLALILAAFLASPALAADKGEFAQCAMQENVFIVVNFNALAQSYSEAKKKLDEKIQLVNDTAKQVGNPKLSNLTWNYGINSQMINYDNGLPDHGFLLSASGNYQIDTLENASKLSDALLKLKFQTNINVNRYRKPGCEIPFN